MTASTPTMAPAPGDGSLVGIPPPPAHTTTAPRSSSQLIGWISRICFGSGEGTTRRHAEPSGRNAQPFLAASASAAPLS